MIRPRALVLIAAASAVGVGAASVPHVRSELPGPANPLLGRWTPGCGLFVADHGDVEFRPDERCELGLSVTCEPASYRIDGQTVTVILAGSGSSESWRVEGDQADRDGSCWERAG